MIPNSIHGPLMYLVEVSTSMSCSKNWVPPPSRLGELVGEGCQVTGALDCLTKIVNTMIYVTCEQKFEDMMNSITCVHPINVRILAKSLVVLYVEGLADHILML